MATKNMDLMKQIIEQKRQGTKQQDKLKRPDKLENLVNVSNDIKVEDYSINKSSFSTL